MKFRATLAALLAFGACMLASPSHASTYSSTSCHVGWTTTPRLSVTRYTYGSGVQYHMDLNSGDGWYQWKITFDGITLPGTNDQYRNVSGGYHTIKGYWDSLDLTGSCQVGL